ncbi:MAG: YfhO family protein [Verrucomicrobia bacterium]|nr:MAG: YfhO family protein [Verrucomicrobiota bacterium]
MATPASDTRAGTPGTRRTLGITAGVLLLLLAGLFHGVLQPGHILFSNDGPLGVISAASGQLPGAFTGVWQDLNWLGTESPAATPNFTQIAGTLAGGPEIFARLYAPLSLLLLGSAAAFCGRRMGFAMPVSLLLGIAAALNSNYFSHACWGLPGRGIAAACIFAALGLAYGPGGKVWASIVLAGFAVGLNVTEAADSGALLSLYFAGALVWNEWTSRDGNAARRAVSAVSKLAVVVIAAGWIAFGSITTLINTSVKGVAAIGENQSDAQRWEFITGWSFPKAEIVRIAVPGILGYRMDTPDGGAYWGAVGPDGDPQHRFSGGGEYAGVLVLVGAAWALVRSLARGPSPFTETERRRVWFWAIAAVVSLLFAFGRHAPFYHLVFPLPFFRTMRIPMKFLHGFHLATLVLFAHGLEALAREHLAGVAGRDLGLAPRLRAWWAGAKTPVVERRFVVGILVVVIGAVLAAIAYLSYQPDLVAHLQTLVSKEQAPRIVQHSLWEIGVFVGFLGAVGLAFALVFAGAFAGPNSRTAWWILAVLLAVDLYHANTPWVIHYDYLRRYQSNVVIDFLAGKPAESRVAARLLPTTRQLLVAPDDGLMPAVHNLWLEHHFQRYNIQTVDIIQAPRMPALDEAFLRAFEPRTNELAQGDLHVVGRFWQLTGTRYLMAARAYEGQLNSAFAPANGPLVPRLGFDLAPKPDADLKNPQADDFDAVANPNGRYALFELTGSLPRVGLHSLWQVSTNDAETLVRLRDPAFDPTRTVLLATAPGAQPVAGTTNGTARIESYAPKRLVVKTQSASPAVLLDNDRWHEDWNVAIDGQPAALLRANHIMRAVVVPAGEHTVEFRFRTDTRPLWVSVSACVAALALAGFLAFPGSRGAPARPDAGRKATPAGA